MSAPTYQIINQQGCVEQEALQTFVDREGLARAGNDYGIVAIMGPQSSGKSTLLNHVFGTSFREMNAELGRSQTTQGVWLARSQQHSDCLVLMDLEGSDSRERGEEDTAFEKKTALLALASADVVVVNMWCHDVGREAGAGKPLLRTVLEVNLRLFRPEAGRTKTRLLFVIRDMSRKTPLESISSTLEEDLSKIWEGVAKPPEYDGTTIQQFFDVDFHAMPNYEDRPEDFAEDARHLRAKFTPGGPFAPAGGAGARLPGGALPVSIEKMWELIDSNKDVNLPAHRILVANIRCKEIADTQLAAAAEAEAWGALKQQAGDQHIPEFGLRVQRFLAPHLTQYDEEAALFDAAVRQERRAELLRALLAMVQPVFRGQVRRVVARALELASNKLDALNAESFAREARAARENCVASLQKSIDALLPPDADWDTSEDAGEALERIEDVIAARRSALMRQCVDSASAASRRELLPTLAALSEAPADDYWDQIDAQTRRHVKDAVAALQAQLAGLGLPEGELSGALASLESSLEAIAMDHVREVAVGVQSRMRDAFSSAFNVDEDGVPRTWQPSDDIAAATAAARARAASVLALLAVDRSRAPADKIRAVEESIVAMSERQTQPAGLATPVKSRPGAAKGEGAFRAEVDGEWVGIARDHVLLGPLECRRAWRRHLEETGMLVAQAVNTQNANRNAMNRMPPAWALFAMVVLGFNEVVSVLSNPVLLVIVVCSILFLRTLYVELSVDQELSEKGLLPGLISIGMRARPAAKKVASNLLAEVLGMFAGGEEEEAGRGPRRRRGSGAARTEPRESKKDS